MLDVISSILITLGILGFLIFIHELGHFLAAKFVGAGAEEFAIGMGPKLFSFKRGETLYRINLLPIGGYVKITGETEEVDSPKSLKKKSKPAQILVMLAGVTLNFIFACIVYWVGIVRNDYVFPLPDSFSNFQPVVGEVYSKKLGDIKYDRLLEGKGADNSGMPDSGVIAGIDGFEPKLSKDFVSYLQTRKDTEVNINVCNDEKKDCKEYKVKTDENGKIGISLLGNYMTVLDYGKNKLLSGVGHSLNMVKLMSTQLGSIFSKARQTGDYSEVANNVSGPVGVYLVVDSFKQYGLFTLLALSADLSLVLAVMNVLPIPALDGGRVVLIAGEALAGRFWSRKIENILINVSFILLILLMLGVIFKDIYFFKDLQELLR